MKYSVVFNYNTRNLGDDIQSYAAMKLLPQVDIILDRENLNHPDITQKSKFICNGWFMDNPQNWPPAPNLIPLFISFHTTNSNNTYKRLLSKDLYNYYKKFEPIGCRDTFTLNLFKSMGIKAYFSGCLTLTLENPFRENERTEEIIVVDPFSFYLKKDFKEKIINKLVPQSLKNNIIYITHRLNETLSIEKRIINTQNLIERYAKAHLIITSRIHAALPALALGTPVIFIDLGYNKINLRSRFGGLIELFNVINSSNIPFTDSSYFSRIYRKINMYDIYYPIRDFDFDWDNPPKPPNKINDIANKIKEQVNNFIL